MRVTKTLLAVAAAVLAVVEPAFAQDHAAAGGASLAQFGAGFGIGIAALGGALGQGKLVSSAVESISRNPGAAGQMNTPIILGLAFIESLVLFAFVIGMMLLGKI